MSSLLYGENKVIDWLARVAASPVAVRDSPQRADRAAPVRPEERTGA
ncbi:hypothetical protein [Paenibacillus caui]|nr:hypothetical protein [Paenibacillus caui]